MTKRPFLDFLFYPLRSAVLLGSIAMVWFYFLKKTYLNVEWGSPDEYRLLGLMAQLDVLHFLFYAVWPAILVVLFLPFRTDRLFSPAIRVDLALAGGVFCGGLPLAAQLLSRPLLFLDWPQFIVGFYLTLNVAVMIHSCLGGLKEDGLLSRLRFFWPVSDLVLPAGVWAATRARCGAASSLFRIWPAFLIGFVPTIPWLFHTMPYETTIRTSGVFQRILPGPFFQVAIDPANGDIIAVSDRNETVTRLNPVTNRTIQTPQDEAMGLFQGAALDPDTRRLIYLSMRSNLTRVLNADNLQTIRSFKNGPARPQASELARPYWYPHKKILFAVCDDGLAFLCPDARSIFAFYEGQSGDAMFDEKRNEILYAAWFSGLIAFDPETAKPKRWMALPKVIDRIAKDGDRLFVSAPYLARVIVVDLAEFKVHDRIPTIPGVRTLFIDVAGRRLLLGGLSPYLEIRSLDDYSLIARFRSPPWTRWMESDLHGGKIYLTTRAHGLWELDLEKTRISEFARFLQRNDPFFLILSEISLRIQRSLKWDPEKINPFVPMPTKFYKTQTCSEENWTRD